MARQPDADLDELVTALLVASRVLVGVSARSLAEVEDVVTVPQFRLLVVLDGHGPVSLNGLAELLDVNASTALRMIDRLVASGLVAREADPGDRRVVLVRPTREAERVVRRVSARRRREIARVVAAMPPAGRGRLVQALREFADAAGEPATGPSLLGW